jgi:hypothetical protein
MRLLIRLLGSYMSVRNVAAAISKSIVTYTRAAVFGAIGGEVMTKSRALTWLFQCNPKRFDLAPHLKSGVTEDNGQ